MEDKPMILFDYDEDELELAPSLRCSDLGACSYPPKPNEFCTTSSAASGSSWPCAFRRALTIRITI